MSSCDRVYMINKCRWVSAATNPLYRAQKWFRERVWVRYWWRNWQWWRIHEWTGMRDAEERVCNDAIDGKLVNRSRWSKGDWRVMVPIGDGEEGEREEKVCERYWRRNWGGCVRDIDYQINGWDGGIMRVRYTWRNHAWVACWWRIYICSVQQWG